MMAFMAALSTNAAGPRSWQRAAPLETKAWPRSALGAEQQRRAGRRHGEIHLDQTLEGREQVRRDPQDLRRARRLGSLLLGVVPVGPRDPDRGVEHDAGRLG